ncbi:MAG: hypothetical protein C0462_00010 [Alcanivorax sp.]|nr:hypothetical protein [Alcanivorax sp.]
MMRYFLIVMAAMLLTACGGDSDERRFLTGYMVSPDPDVIDLDDEVNALLGSRCNTNEDFWYQVAVYDPSGDGSHSEWTLLFQVPSNATGRYRVSDATFRLLSDYRLVSDGSSSNCIEHEYDKIFRAVDGYVDFVDVENADFSLQFEKRQGFNSTTPTPDTPEVLVEGCWKVDTDRRNCWPTTANNDEGDGAP